MVPERNNLKHIPRPPLVTPPFESLPEQDKQIYKSNNIRLDQLEEQLHDISTFGGACDELIVWLQDSRAYNQYNENSLIACIAAIYENAKEFGLWSGCNILKLAANQQPGSLSKAGRAFIKQCYIEIHTTNSGRRPSDASINSVHSPMAASPSIGISPQSPVTNHGMGSPSFNQLARSVHESNFLPQSPVTVTSSPHTSPFFSNSTANPTPNDDMVDSTNTTPSIAIPHHHELQQFLTRKQMDDLYRQQQASQVRQQNPNYMQNTYQNGTGSNHQMLAAQTHLNTFYPSQRAHIQQQQQQQHLQPPQQQYQQKQSPQQYHHQQQQMAAMAALSRLNPQEQTQLYNQHLQQQIRQNQYRQQQHQQQQHQQQQLQQQLAQQQSQLHLLAQQQQQIQNHQFQQRMVNQLLRTTNGTTSNASTTSNGSSSNPTTPTTPGFPQDFHVFPPAQTTPTRNTVPLPPSSQAPNVSSVQLVSSTTQTVAPSITVPTTASPALAVRTTVQPPATVRLTVLPPKPPVTVRTTQPTTPSSSIHPRIPPATAPTTAQPGPPRPTITPIPSTYNTNNLHLPGGGQSKSMIPFSSNPNADKLRFKFKAGYAVKPFILEHEGKTRKQFFLGSEDYERIWKGPETTFKDTNGKVALTFVLNCHFLNTAEQKCDWPDSLVAELNGRQLPLVRRVRHVTPTGATYQGKDHPFDFTSIVHRGSNAVTLTRTRNTNGKSYIFSVQIFNRFSENHIRNLVKASSIDISETESLLFRLLGKNSQSRDEDDIVVLQDSVRVSLKCPITMTRIQNPVRGKKCKHINCFDLSNYITLNDLATPTWKCPHCSIEVGPDQLARDLFTEKLLAELPKHATEIEYTKNTSSYSITKVDDVDDGEDSGDEEKPMKIETPPVKPPEKTVDVIDLISDDESEDDEPLAKRMRL